MTEIKTATHTFNVENMLRCAIGYAMDRKRRRTAAFVAADLFGLGSTSAHKLMNHLRLDTETGNRIDIHGFREEYQGADIRIRLRDPKGGNPAEWPPDLRVRQFPCGVTINQ